MLPDRVSNPGPLTYESGALPIALRGLALPLLICWMGPFVIKGYRVYFVTFILLLMVNPVSKHCRP